MTTNSEAGLSPWERQVFAAMTGAAMGTPIPLADFTTILAQPRDEKTPTDEAFAEIVENHLNFHYGEAGEKPVEIPSTIEAGLKDGFHGSTHEVLKKVVNLQQTYFWGATETILHEAIELCTTIENDDILKQEKEFLAFLDTEIFDGIATHYSEYHGEDVENGFITELSQDDIEKLAEAMQRVSVLSKS